MHTLGCPQYDCCESSYVGAAWICCGGIEERTGLTVGKVSRTRHGYMCRMMCLVLGRRCKFSHYRVKWRERQGEEKPWVVQQV